MGITFRNVSHLKFPRPTGYTMLQMHCLILYMYIYKIYIYISLPIFRRIEESIGDAWWPSSWRCPSAFAHVLYFVAPPSRLQPGQFDLMREARERIGMGMMGIGMAMGMGMEPVNLF